MTAKLMNENLDYVMSANIARAGELLRFGLFEECRRLCQENIEHFQSIAEPSGRQIATTAESQAMRGECAFLSGDYAGARINYLRAVRLAPRESVYWLRLEQICARLFKDSGDAMYDSESAAAFKNVYLLQKKAGTTWRNGNTNSKGARDNRFCG